MKFEQEEAFLDAAGPSEARPKSRLAFSTCGSSGWGSSLWGLRKFVGGCSCADIRLVYESAEYQGVRATTTAWGGTFVIESNRILRTSIINNWNLDRGFHPFQT